jgi:hypothetical protein
MLCWALLALWQPSPVNHPQEHQQADLRSVVIRNAESVFHGFPPLAHSQLRRCRYADSQRRQCCHAHVISARCCTIIPQLISVTVHQEALFEVDAS